MGHLVQMAGLAVQNFASAAVGMAVAVALIRGFTRTRTDRIGNFWVDLVRGCLRILLPLAVVGTRRAARAWARCRTSPPAPTPRRWPGVHQTITGGPVASQEAIKELGTNGGGFYNANSAHPFENPNALSNILEIFLLLLIPVCLDPHVRADGEGQAAGLRDPGRDGRAVGARSWPASASPRRPTTAPRCTWPARRWRARRPGSGCPPRRCSRPRPPGTSTGAVNSFHDSFTSLGGGLAIFNMGLGEVAPGGIGSGLYGILVLAIVTVFIAGLMVGRTPEYLRKKITVREIKLVSLYILTMPVIVLAGTGLAMALSKPKESILNPGPHGLSEVLYAFMSADEQQRLGVRRHLGEHRLLQHRARPVHAGRAASSRSCSSLALAGSLARQQPVPATAGTLPTHRPLFVGMLVGVVDHRRRPDVLPGAGARPAGGGPVMSTSTPTSPRLMPHPPHRRGSAGGPARPEDAAHLAARRSPQARPAGDGPQPGDVRRRGRRRARPPRSPSADPTLFAWSVVVWLWLTVVFANLAEAVAEGRGKAQAASLRRAKTETIARRLRDDGTEEDVPGPQLTLGDRVVVEAGQVIPGDGDVVEGVASVDESAITGESAPVIRESGGDRSSVTGGTKVLSDRIVVADHRQARRELHRPDDRAGRGRLAAEDAERDRAEHPARQPHDRVPDGDGDPAAVRDLLRRRSSP